MSSFLVEGGHALRGEVVPQGAKNEALQVICATLLTREPVHIENVPKIRDVSRLTDILRDLGVEVRQTSEESYTFQAKNLDEKVVKKDSFQHKLTQLRGSIMLIAPLLHRLGRFTMASPGGDKVGKRRSDTLMRGLERMGVRCGYAFHKDQYSFSTDGFVGRDIRLDEASVTGTANLVMAAVVAKGETSLYHAACEPYIQQLCHMLVRMGANISGIGTNLLRISGVAQLGGAKHKLLADMVEVGSFVGMAALTRSELTIKGIDLPHLGATLSLFEKLGISLSVREDHLVVPKQDIYTIKTFIDGSIMTLSDSIWPGISPDLISIGIVTATQARGSVLFHQHMFESRLFFVDKLIQMGAHITLCDPHRALVVGLGRKKPLRAIRMSSPDIRAGVALLIAALSAEGTSQIDNIEQIDRGYQHLQQRLTKLGAKIKRID